MFKVPNNNRLDEIADMIPEFISVMDNKETGYNARISKLGEVSRASGIAREVGISVGIPKSIDYDFLMKIIKDNDIPEFAVVISSIGRYRIVFGTLPIIVITRKYGDYCIGGRIIVVSNMSISKKEVKRMMASGLESCYHVNTKNAYAF